MTARALRPAPPPPATPEPSELPDDGVLRWFEPDPSLRDELVLSGECRGAIETVARELRHTQAFLDAGVDPTTRLLFSGPSGTGKTLAARWLGALLRLPLAIADVSEVVASHLGETSTNLGAIFKATRERASILFLDEIDALCAKRGGGNGSACDLELARATTTLLQQLDWLPLRHIVIAATNFHDGLDSALRRRLTTDIVFTLPDRDARARMVGRWLAKAPLEQHELDELVDGSDGLSGAELRSRAMARARRAILARTPVGQACDSKRAAEASAASAQQLLKVLDDLGGR